MAAFSTPCWWCICHIKDSRKTSRLQQVALNLKLYKPYIPPGPPCFKAVPKKAKAKQQGFAMVPPFRWHFFVDDSHLTPTPLMTPFFVIYRRGLIYTGINPAGNLFHQDLIPRGRHFNFVAKPCWLLWMYFQMALNCLASRQSMVFFGHSHWSVIFLTRGIRSLRN